MESMKSHRGRRADVPRGTHAVHTQEPAVDSGSRSLNSPRSALEGDGGVVDEDDRAVDELRQVRDPDFVGQGTDGVGLSRGHVERSGPGPPFDVETLGPDRAQKRIIGRCRPLGEQRRLRPDERRRDQVAVAGARIFCPGGFEEPIGLLGERSSGVRGGSAPFSSPRRTAHCAGQRPKRWPVGTGPRRPLSAEAVGDQPASCNPRSPGTFRIRH